MYCRPWYESPIMPILPLVYGCLIAIQLIFLHHRVPVGHRHGVLAKEAAVPRAEKITNT